MNEELEQAIRLHYQSEQLKLALYYRRSVEKDRMEMLRFRLQARCVRRFERFKVLAKQNNLTTLNVGDQVSYHGNIITIERVTKTRAYAQGKAFNRVGALTNVFYVIWYQHGVSGIGFATAVTPVHRQQEADYELRRERSQMRTKIMRWVDRASLTDLQQIAALIGEGTLT
jgi:hypothetical protein